MRWPPEDQLSEAVGKRLLAEAGPALRLGHVVRQDGAGYLRKRMRSWCQMASHQPVLLLTDLDREVCAPTLVRRWLAKLPRPMDLVFRVAVREVEAWLLADHEAMHRLLGKTARLPTNPDGLTDPKRHLLALAERAPRAVRRDLVAERGSVAAQGIGYNARLCALVEREWCPERAAARSESLRRARTRIDELARRKQPRE